ncbi:hypothetical protein ABH955_000579 [Bacillus sp. RC240]
MFINRYHAACKMYIDEHNAKECANVIFQNSNFDDPVVVFKGI